MQNYIISLIIVSFIGSLLYSNFDIENKFKGTPINCFVVIYEFDFVQVVNVRDRLCKHNPPLA